MVITSSTRNRVGGNTPRGFESHLLRQNKDHPSGWSLFFTEGGIRKAALRNMPVACFNRRGFSAEKESHRPDLSARSIRRERRLLAECRWHSATAVGARRPTTSKIFNGCSRSKANPPSNWPARVWQYGCGTAPANHGRHAPDPKGRTGCSIVKSTCTGVCNDILPFAMLSRRGAQCAPGQRKIIRFVG